MFQLKPRWIIKKERMGEKWYYMIYLRCIFGDWFLERWNTPLSAAIRLAELEGR